MAEWSFTAEQARLREVFSRLTADRAVFLAGYTKKTEAELHQPPQYVEVDFFDAPAYWFIMFPFEPFEAPETHRINNIHQGVLFAANKVFGGPYVEMQHNPVAGGSTVDVTLILRPSFMMQDYRVVRTSENLRKYYNDLKKMLKSKRSRQQ